MSIQNAVRNTSSFESSEKNSLIQTAVEKTFQFKTPWKNSLNKNAVNKTFQSKTPWETPLHLRAMIKPPNSNRCEENILIQNAVKNMSPILNAVRTTFNLKRREKTSILSENFNSSYYRDRTFLTMVYVATNIIFHVPRW